MSAPNVIAWPSAIDAAIRQQLQHGAAALADPGTESVLEQVFAAPSRHHTGFPPAQQEPSMAPDAHHLPAALTQPHAPPAPVPFPARPANARTHDPSDTTRRRWARMAQVEAERTADAHARGVRQGYRQGWRWGLACGVVLGAMLAGVCWGTWLVVNVPDAAPTAAATVL